MLVEFNSRFAKKKQDLICDVIAFGSDKLSSSLSNITGFILDIHDIKITTTPFQYF